MDQVLVGEGVCGQSMVSQPLSQRAEKASLGGLEPPALIRLLGARLIANLPVPFQLLPS